MLCVHVWLSCHRSTNQVLVNNKGNLLGVQIRLFNANTLYALIIQLPNSKLWKHSKGYDDARNLSANIGKSADAEFGDFYFSAGKKAVNNTLNIEVELNFYSWTDFRNNFPWSSLSFIFHFLFGIRCCSRFSRVSPFVFLNVPVITFGDMWFDVANNLVDIKCLFGKEHFWKYHINMEYLISELPNANLRKSHLHISMYLLRFCKCNSNCFIREIHLVL